jgi:hypothetical protein
MEKRLADVEAAPQGLEAPEALLSVADLSDGPE